MAVLSQMRIISLEELESNLGVQRLPAFIEHCESMFLDRIRQIAGHIAADPGIKAVFVSGPTSSGKTTFSTRLTIALAELGCRTHLVSMDDYYHLKEIDFDDYGRPDYESISMLDTDLMLTQLSDLFQGRRVTLPHFDFVTRSRSWMRDRELQLTGHDLVLVEGLHGLSELVSGQLDHHQYYGVFIMPWCTLLDGRQLLGSRDLRVLRRISRDVRHRGSTALSTIDYWPMIEKIEQSFIPPYLARADEYINSSLPYEFCVIAPLAAREIQKSLDQHAADELPRSVYLRDREEHYADLTAALEEAACLIDACARIPEIDRSLVPPHSILNEFI